jgi:hypothetical protein
MINFNKPKYKNLAAYLKIDKIDETNINEVSSMFYVLPQKHTKTDKHNDIHCFCGRPLTHYFYVINKTNRDILIAGEVCKDTTFHLFGDGNTIANDIWFRDNFKESFASAKFINITDWDKYIEDCILQYFSDAINSTEFHKLLEIYKNNWFITMVINKALSMFEAKCKKAKQDKINNFENFITSRINQIKKMKKQKQVEIDNKVKLKEVEIVNDRLLARYIYQFIENDNNKQEKKCLYIKNRLMAEYTEKVRQKKIKERNKKEKEKRELYFKSEKKRKIKQANLNASCSTIVTGITVDERFCDKLFISKYDVQKYFDNYEDHFSDINKMYFIQSNYKNITNISYGNASDYTDTIYRYYLTESNINFIQKYFKI